MRLLLFVILLALSACTAQTPYSDIPVNQLSDEQLVEELISAANGLGIELNRSMYLMAVRPEPAYVLTSSSSTFHGTVASNFNMYSMPVGYGQQIYGQGTGTMAGTSNTQYQYTDVNATARLGNALATAISQARVEAYRSRGLEVIDEYEKRVKKRRQETQALIEDFFSQNPELGDRRTLVAAVVPWAAADSDASNEATLRRTRELIQNIERGEGLSGNWYGVFSQTTTLEDGETVAFTQYVKIDLTETENDQITGKGMLGSGEVIELTGSVNSGRMEAIVANITSGINVTFSAITAEDQMTGEFDGFGAGQRVQGTVLLLR